MSSGNGNRADWYVVLAATGIGAAVSLSVMMEDDNWLFFPPFLGCLAGFVIVVQTPEGDPDSPIDIAAGAVVALLIMSAVVLLIKKFIYT